ncbi:MFS general substrate transporter [Lentinus tigrinus ALCF2SS1-7]|uniref:MFS general substrate transporter n=1 Tax=Lentinus tigrinus ALCF2SS1-6 TaxID=1328759 RepID=A0A5C2T2D5_9APHY|nr:MFS general substrate transporter [Lentinus tigrinus ALCF2SS1-6]RPD80525.1 MFS general substrate transporter [Lentinus tigrinus ALCF2SS1-7]
MEHHDTVQSSTSSTRTVSRPQADDIHEKKKSFDEEKQESKPNLAAEFETAVEGPEVVHGKHPDGGLKAWSVVFGCAAGACATFGLVNAWGVFQAYYTESILEGTSPSTIAWIGSIQYALIFIPGLVVGRIFDMGYTKLPLSAASALLVAATFLTAQCSEYWQFLLCQGIAMGISAGVIFGIIMGCPAHWFKHRLGMALGIMALGSSCGGTLFPIIIRNLINAVGFQWTMRIMGFIEIALVCLMIATVERRLPPRPHSGTFISFEPFKSTSFTLYSISSFLCFLGIYTCLTYLDVSAVSEGISESFAFYLLAIANGCSAIGRVVGGYLADRTGPLNIMTPATIIAGVMTYIWPFATSVGGNIGVAIVYGMSSGIYVSLLVGPIVRMGKTHDVGVRVGMSMTLIALGAVAGPPISGAINDATGGFKFVGVYAGSAVMIACAFMVATRFSILGGFWGKV